MIKDGVIHYVGKGVQAPKPANVEQPEQKEKKKPAKTASKKK